MNIQSSHTPSSQAIWRDTNYLNVAGSVSISVLSCSPLSTLPLYRSAPAAPPRPPPAILAPVFPPPGDRTFLSPSAVGLVWVTGMETGAGFGALTGDGFGA